MRSKGFVLAMLRFLPSGLPAVKIKYPSLVQCKTMNYDALDSFAVENSDEGVHTFLGQR